MILGYSDKDVARFMAAKDDVIQAQREVITFLRGEVTRERQRAEIAVDRLLEKQKVMSVMPERVQVPTKEEREARTRALKEVEAVRAAMESVGDCGSDPAERVDVHEDVPGA